MKSSRFKRYNGYTVGVTGDTWAYGAERYIRYKVGVKRDEILVQGQYRTKGDTQSYRSCGAMGTRLASQTARNGYTGGGNGGKFMQGYWTHLVSRIDTFYRPYTIYTACIGCVFHCVSLNANRAHSLVRYLVLSVTRTTSAPITQLFNTVCSYTF